MSEILIELESSLAEQENSSKSIQLMLSNLQDDITYSKSNPVNDNKIDKKTITELLIDADDVDVALVCPKCNNFMFENDVAAKAGLLNESSKECCKAAYKRYHEISRTNLEYWYSFMNDPFGTINLLPNYTRFLFYSTEGIPAKLRSRVWGLLLNSCTNFGDIGNDWCESLFANLNDENSPYLRVIVNDLNRIFPNLNYFQDKNLGQANLKNILNAYSIYDSEIGYCQGLSFLVGLFLFHFKSNPMTFLASINIFEQNKNLNFKKIFDEKMSGLKLWFYQFEEIFKIHNPDLYNHFLNRHIDIKLFTSKWFLSFFAVGCPMQILIKLFDIMIIEGFQSSIFKISLIILEKHKSHLLNLNDVDEIHSLLLSSKIWDIYESNLGDIVNDLLSLDPDLVSQAKLSQLETKFKKEQSRFTPVVRGHKHSVSSLLQVNVPKPKTHETSKSVDLTLDPKTLTAPVSDSKSVANTPSESESGFFKFFKYGFSNPGSAATTPTIEQTPIGPRNPDGVSIDHIMSEDHTNSMVNEENSHSAESIVSEDSQSTKSSNLFDDIATGESTDQSSETTSPILSNDEAERKQKIIVKEIFVSSPDMQLEKGSLPSNESHNPVKSLSCSSGFEDSGLMEPLPAPSIKNALFGTEAHSKSTTDLHYGHRNQGSISNMSLSSNSTEASTFSPNLLSPQSAQDPTFANFNNIMNSNGPTGFSPPLKNFNHRLSHQRGHSYSPSVSSISSFGQKKSKNEMRELEMASEMESMKYKLQSLEKVISDDKKLIKNLFKLYLLKDELTNPEDLNDQERLKLENKLRKREYKVLQEVEERLRL